VSIRLRLALWYGGSVLVLFLATGLVLRFALREILVREHRVGVERSAEVARGVFRAEVGEYRTTRATVAHIASELVVPDQTLEFVRPDGDLFARTTAPLLRDGRLEPPIYSVERPLDEELAPGWIVRVNASMAPLHESLGSIDRSLLFVVPVTVLLAVVVGWWLTGRTLHPVGEMAAAAEGITAASLGARIPVVNPHDELGRLARRFNDLLERLAQALDQQRRFLAEAAHELRTPVARMLSQAERALAQGATAGDVTGSLRLIHGDLERTRGLVGELLHLARVDAGEPAPPLTAGYLDDVVANAIQPWYAVAERGGVRLSVSSLEEAPAQLNSELAERLVGILLDNAIRYTPSGGTVEVSVTRGEGAAVLEVRDSGIGIPADDLERLFERFFRGRAARDRAPEGSGLGLSIAHWIAAQHGGTIDVSSPAAGGTRVRVALPSFGSDNSAFPQHLSSSESRS
jgi:signal transduction histidine kinase